MLHIKILFTFLILVTIFALSSISSAYGQDEPLDPKAPDKPVVDAPLSLDHLALAPPSRDKRFDTRGIKYEPTIVPFSGWRFFGSDGKPQPWRKRFTMYQDKPWDGAGQMPNRDFPEQALLFMQWTAPREAGIEGTKFTPVNGSDLSWVGYHGDYSERFSPYPDKRIYCKRVSFASIDDLPDHFIFNLDYRYGPWETVATARADTEFPVGDKFVKLTYAGQMRPDSAVAKQLERSNKRHLEKHGRTPYTGVEIESEITWTKRTHAWHHEVACFLKKDQPLRSIRGVGTGPNYSIFQNGYQAKFASFDRIELRRIKSAITRLDTVEIAPVVEIWSDELVNQRIKITAKSRFVKPKTLTIHELEPGQDCLVDLDNLKITRLPEPAPKGVALAKFLHQHGIDMVVKADGKQWTAQTFACPVFPIADEAWTQSPNQTIQTIRKQSIAHQSSFEVSEHNTTWLLTTAEGTMMLLRIKPDQADDAGRKRFMFEIRHLEQTD